MRVARGVRWHLLGAFSRSVSCKLVGFLAGLRRSRNRLIHRTFVGAALLRRPDTYLPALRWSAHRDGSIPLQPRGHSCCSGFARRKFKRHRAALLSLPATLIAVLAASQSRATSACFLVQRGRCVQPEPLKEVLRSTVQCGGGDLTPPRRVSCARKHPCPRIAPARQAAPRCAAPHSTWRCARRAQTSRP
jgi:hypothetical protein